MAANPLQRDLRALQRLVDFAEGASSVMPVVLVESGEGLVAIGSSTLPKARAMTADRDPIPTDGSSATSYARSPVESSPVSVPTN